MLNRSRIRQMQIVVPSGTATLEPLGFAFAHFGQVDCPFCGRPQVVAGPRDGLGTAYCVEPCSHNLGTAAGAGLDITILFSGPALVGGAK